MISNRAIEDGELSNTRGALTFWITDSDDVRTLQNWKSISADEFRTQLVAAAEAFPSLPASEQENQKHVTIFVHGYNETWADAAAVYQSIVSNLFRGDASLGLCILFTWPSAGAPLDYLPDREQARASAPDLAAVLDQFYDWLLAKQVAAARNPDRACRAKTSIIAHSMGNYVLQEAMNLSWNRKNQPLLVSLVSQLLMVAADVDNDLFDDDAAPGKSAGDGIANLTYRVTALYTGRDPILGLSAGLKHFGKRRLGRSGLDRSPGKSLPDNVWDVDCSSLIPPDATNIHSSYFQTSSPKTLELMRQVLRGVDRTVLATMGLVPARAAAHS